jgi:putative ATP-dependent endonuclease of OLD family
MVGDRHAVETTLSFSPTDQDRLLRSLRLFIDGGKREISAASLGSANTLYLTLKALENEQLFADRTRHHTFLAIEEPEAHLHPHLQRLVYRDYLQPPREQKAGADRNETILLTTHSPHITSVAPVNSIVVLRRNATGESTEGVSTAKLRLDPQAARDLERYLDVTRGEILFAKGVVLVEGDAERFVLPVLAREQGVDFDEHGISVCSVAGTNFAPYLALLGEHGLRLPVAVVTDGDPAADGRRLGEARILTLLEKVALSRGLADKGVEQQLEAAASHGLFVGEHTLEVDLFRAGLHEAITDTLIELAPSQAARERAEEWREQPARFNPEIFLRDLSSISKGRFAQRLSTRALADHCPSYLTDAIQYVRARCH